jgi:Zn-dependent peptidase ImmA (M78 family)
MNFKIPEEFYIAGQKWVVKYTDDLLVADDEYGSCNVVTNTIILDGSKCIPDSRREATFIHELLHAILNEMGHVELFKDEQFIDTLSTLIHQALITAK